MKICRHSAVFYFFHKKAVLLINACGQIYSFLPRIPKKEKYFKSVHLKYGLRALGLHLSLHKAICYFLVVSFSRSLGYNKTLFLYNLLLKEYSFHSFSELFFIFEASNLHLTDFGIFIHTHENCGEMFQNLSGIKSDRFCPIEYQDRSA